MMQHIIGRHFFWHYLRLCAIFFCAIVVLVMLIDLMQQLHRYGGYQNYSTFTIFLVCALHTPALVQNMLPLVCLFAALAHFIFLNRRRELLLASCLGRSTLQLVSPACCSAFIVAIFGILLLNPLAAYTTQQAKRVIALKSNTDTHFLELSQQPHWLSQTSDDQTTYINAPFHLRSGSLLRPTFIIFSRDRQKLRWLHAKEAVLQQGYWLLKEVQLYEKGEKVQYFPTFQIKTGLTAPFIEEALTTSDTVPYYRLAQKIRLAHAFGLQDTTWWLLIWKLSTLPFFLIGITLVAACLTLRFERFYPTKRIVFTAAVLGFFFYSLDIIAQLWGRTQLLPPLAAASFAPALCLLSGLLFLLKKET